MSYFAAGQWNADCDQCGRMFKSGSLRRQWNGLYTCSQCWEPRQPQDFVRAVKDNSPPEYVRGRNFDGTTANILFPLSARQTTIVVDDGSAFPNQFPYFCNIQDDTDEELVQVISKVGTAPAYFTVVRGYNSTPQVFS